MSSMITFTAPLVLDGRTATGIAVPDEVVARLGAGKRFAVVVTIGGYSYRSTIGPYRGATMLPVSAANRAEAGISAGDEVTVGLELDEAPRTVEVPEDLATALAQASLTEAFGALSVSNRRAHVVSVEGAKTSETRERRVQKVLAALGG
jgi:hypothetical protein